MTDDEKAEGEITQVVESTPPPGDVDEDALAHDEKTDGEIVVDEILDGPGDFHYPFSDLRLHKFPEELRVTRELRDAIATTMEDANVTGGAKACVGIGLCLWAINQLESELVALRGERSGGQDS